MTTAELLKTRGMQLALDSKPDWSAQAEEWFNSLPEDWTFTSEDLILAVGLPTTAESGINQNNAVGAKMRSWAGRTQEVGFRKTVRITSHSRRIIVWRKK